MQKTSLNSIYLVGKKHGIKIVAVSLLPWGNYSRWSERQQRNLIELNKYMKSNTNVNVYINAYDYMGNGTKYLDKGFDKGDGLHLNKIGQRALGRFMTGWLTCLS